MKRQHITKLLRNRINVLSEWPDATGYVAGGMYELERIFSIVSNNAEVDFHLCVDCGVRVEKHEAQCSNCRIQL